jgi:hypothetical protein
MSKRDYTPAEDALFESLTAFKSIPETVAQARNDMPQSLDDYKLPYVNMLTCAFDADVISDTERMISVNGKYYHNSDCASADSQITDFYETMPTDEDPLDAELDKIKADEIRRSLPVAVVLTHDEIDLLYQALTLHQAQLFISAENNSEPPAEEHEQARQLRIKLLVERNR